MASEILPIAGHHDEQPGLFPLRIPLRGPSTVELGAAFDEARRWIAELSGAEASPGFHLQWREFNHRQLGQNRIPVAAVFDTLEDALAFCGKRRDADRLHRAGSTVLARYPSLEPWFLRRPLEALDRVDEWPTILATLDWFHLHPRSGRYLRQVDAPGVHTKFIEGRRGLLSELLDLVLAPDAIDSGASGVGAFNRRYGLIDKPVLVRMRSLDEAASLHVSGPGSHGIAVGEIAVRQQDFADLFEPGASPFNEVFITENEVNYVAFPSRHDAAVILGGGYGFSQLAAAGWLHRARIRYWGDLDTHGFAILDQFRSTFPEAESFLMDRQTLLAHQNLWTAEPSQTRAELPRLTPEESSLYDDLRNDRLATAVRLEQERLNFSWIEAALGQER